VKISVGAHKEALLTTASTSVRKAKEDSSELKSLINVGTNAVTSPAHHNWYAVHRPTFSNLFETLPCLLQTGYQPLSPKE
jgi:hypothetical protein